jgi:hypothetical protein
MSVRSLFFPKWAGLRWGGGGGGLRGVGWGSFHVQLLKKNVHLFELPIDPDPALFFAQLNSAENKNLHISRNFDLICIEGNKGVKTCYIAGMGGWCIQHQTFFIISDLHTHTQPTRSKLQQPTSCFYNFRNHPAVFIDPTIS